MWIILEFGFILLSVIFIFMELILPSIKNEPIFPDFRKSPKSKPKVTADIDELVDNLKTKVDEEKVSTETKISDSEKELTNAKEKLGKVESIKTKTDKL